MDEQKAYGILIALGRSIGEASRADPALIPAVRAAPDKATLEPLLLRHRGKLPEPLVRDYLAFVQDADFVKERARLILQAKMVAAGREPVSMEDAERGPVKHRT